MLDGQKKWIGNASFADLIIIWAKDVETDRVLGFVVEKDTPGFTTVDLEDKIALRAVQNALITLEGVRVPEENRLQEAHSFRDTANVLRMTRAGVAWSAVGCSRGAYEHALRYANEPHPVRQADRRVPAGAGPAGADARQHHRVGGACAPGCRSCRTRAG